MYDPDRVRNLGRPRGLPFRIGKLGHVVVNVRDVERSARFYTEVLGFQISDVYPEEMVPGGMVFLRCNPDHHGVALVGSMTAEAANVELNHIAFEVATLDEVIRARDHLRRHGSRSISPADGAPAVSSRSNFAIPTIIGWRSTGASIRSAATGMCARRQNGKVRRAWSKPSLTLSAGKTRPCTIPYCSMMKRNSRSDDNANDIAAVGRLRALAGQLPGDPGDLAGIATASDSPTISAPGLPWSGAVTGLPTTARLPWSNTAAGLSRSRIRRTDHRPAATAAGSGPAAARGRDGVDAGLLELGRPLGVGAGPLCRPSLPAFFLGSGPLAATRAELGLDPGALAPVVFGSRIVAE